MQDDCSRTPFSFIILSCSWPDYHLCGRGNTHAKSKSDNGPLSKVPAARYEVRTYTRVCLCMGLICSTAFPVEVVSLVETCTKINPATSHFAHMAYQMKKQINYRSTSPVLQSCIIYEQVIHTVGQADCPRNRAPDHRCE